ncbi:Esterase-like protein [Drechmeria coniospora]|uniref:Esterase-like protein n=1 Tax=Drechmeria coniospora TaxID=98403 RepID=A0A151GLW3_DRECN|nr:Esterase-like protein [Drechmeria coniospora]KYK58089.1 Esterase-like protein [Drechmeria coniospora]
MFVDGPNPTKVQFVPLHKRANPPTPLVLVHDGGGTIFSYFILDSLHRDVWAIHNPRYFDGGHFEGGMDEMARHYIDLILKAGISGTILLGGWSLGGFLSLAMARMLAEDDSTNLTIAGFLIIDSPYHIARSKLTMATSECEIVGIPDLVAKSFDNCDLMLKHWDLPSWDAPACNGDEVKVRVAGRSFTIPPRGLLHKPLDESWRLVETRQAPSKDPVVGSVAPPPAVMVRCTRPAEKKKGENECDPCLIDIFRHKTLLGWEENYPHFIKAVVDVDANHYSVFDKFDQPKV